MKNIALFLCDFTGVMAQPWLEAGYDCILVDPQHPAGSSYRWFDDKRENAVTRIGHIIDSPWVWSKIRDALNTHNIVFVAGFPPCTDLAVSGARWFEEKRKADPAVQFKAMQVVHECRVIGELSGAPWMIENPVSQISTLWRKPDHSFHPYQFSNYCESDNYTKKTCLWTGGGFVMPKESRNRFIGEPDDRIHKAPPGEGRANFRSATPAGFAMAVFLANAPHLKG